VFLPAWEKGIFPNSRAIGENGDIEEERRLAYVAITRAKKLAIISNAETRMMFDSDSDSGMRFKHNEPSDFIGEIDPKYIQESGTSRTREPGTRKIPRHPSSFRLHPSVIGQLVRHAEMGVGVVIEVSDDIYTVAFRDRGIKKVDKRFLISDKSD
jgi:DNA helicase-2/ATP-dependent DNA helicase PcrA